MSAVDLVETLHQDLLRRQLSAIAPHPDLESERRERWARRFDHGLTALRSALTGAGVNDDDLDAALACIRGDSRFHFLYSMPAAASTGGALSEALEMCLFGRSTEEARSIATLLGAFNNLLDGLLDEAPELVEAELESLKALLDFNRWATSPGSFTVERFDDKHPIVRLLYRVTQGWVGRVMRAEGWRRELSVRNEFAEAVEAALDAEYRSIDYQRMDVYSFSIEERRRILSAKSENALWVQALGPICVGGRPTAIDRVDYRECMKLIGRYGGWLDDVRDLVVDLRAGRWSNVLLILYEHAGRFDLASTPDPWPPLVARLAYERTTDALVDAGRTVHERLTHKIASLRLDCPDLLTLISDVTHSYMEPT